MTISAQRDGEVTTILDVLGRHGFVPVAVMRDPPRNKAVAAFFDMPSVDTSTFPDKPAVRFEDPLAAFRKTWETLVRPGDVHELRAIGVGKRKKVLSGYFTDGDAFSRAAHQLDGSMNLYMTINPLRPECLDRSPNRMSGGIDAADDDDVLMRRWVPFDFDPKRPKGVPSTDAEVKLAIGCARRVEAYLGGLGWGVPLHGLSGNGCHLLFRCDLPALDDGFVAGIVKAAKRHVNDPTVTIDTSITNPARIWRLYGSMNIKGIATAERPHRRAKLRIQ